MSFQRRLEKLQHQIQEHIDLADDELTRISQYLIRLKSEIDQSKDELYKLNIRIKQKKTQNEGLIKQNIAHTKSVKAKLITDHQNKLKSIESLFQKEIQELQDQCFASKQKVEAEIPERIAQRIASVENDIQKTKAEIEKHKLLINQTTDVKEDDITAEHQEIQSLEFQRMDDLETAIKLKAQERAESLQHMKERLSQCVQTIEEMERVHRDKTKQLENQIQNLDEKYAEKINNSTSKHSQFTEKARRQIYDSSKKCASIESQIRKMERHHSNEMKSLVAEREMLHSEWKQTYAGPKKDPILNEIEQERARLSQIRMTVLTTEAKLKEKRRENEDLKREIAKKRSLNLISKRRAALQLD